LDLNLDSNETLVNLREFLGISKIKKAVRVKENNKPEKKIIQRNYPVIVVVSRTFDVVTKHGMPCHELKLCTFVIILFRTSHLNSMI
jgi:hypothetical protein